MVQNAHITRHNLILQNSTGRNVDPVAMIGDDNHGTAQRYATTECHVAGHRQMVELDQIGYVSESGQKLADLAEVVVAQFDERRGREHALRRHHQRAAAQLIQVRHDQQQIGGLLDRQESGSWHIDADAALKAFHRRTDSGFQLDDSQTVVHGFVVDNRFHVERFLCQHPIDG